VLDKARAQLMSAQRARESIRRPRKMITTLTPGDVLGYRADSGRWHLMVVRALWESRYELARPMASVAVPTLEGLHHFTTEAPRVADADR
jgi:hypothetical protein